MGLDISKIKNTELKKLAYTADKDNNNSLDKEEFSVFKSEAIEKEGISAKDFNQAMGLYVTNPNEATAATPVTEAKVEKAPKKPDIYQAASAQKTLKQLNSYATAGATREDIVKNMDDITKDSSLREEIASVMSAMPEYETEKDINKKHSEAVKNLEQAGIKDDLHKNILKQLETMAKNEFKNAEAEEFQKAYDNKVKSYQGADKKKTKEEIMKEIKKEAESFKGGFKDAYKIKNKMLVGESAEVVLDAIDRVEDETKGRRIRKAAKENLKETNDYDKYSKKYLNGINSDGKIAANNKGRLNNVEAHKIQTEKEIMKALDGVKDARYLLPALVEAGLVTRRADGKYDLSLLQELIGDQIGDDNKRNRNAAKDKRISEKLKTKSALEIATKLSELSDSEANKLVKLCGYDIEKYNVLKPILAGLVGGLAGASSGVVATVANPIAVNIQKGTIQNKTVVNLTGDFSNVGLGELSDNASITQTAGGLTIEVINIIKRPDQFIKLFADAGSIATTSAIIPAALALLAGLTDEKGEKPVLSNNFTEETIKAYAERIKKENPKYADVAILIASSFVKDGKWDREGYKDFLNTMGGDGGLINRKELIGGLQKRLRDAKNTPVQETPKTEKEEQCEAGKDCNVIITKEKAEDKEITEDLTYTLKKPSQYYWDEIADAYYPNLRKEHPNDWSKILKKALAYDENGNYSQSMYNDMRSGKLPPSINLPLEVEGYKRNDIKAAETLLEEFKNRRNNKARAKDNGGAGAMKEAVGSKSMVVKKVPGIETYIATDGCDSTTASGSTKEEAIERLKETTGKEYKNIIEQ